MSDVIHPQPRDWTQSRKRYASYARDGHLGFATPLHQRLRYEGLLRHVDPTGMRVLDFGCGHGDLFEELSLRGRMPATYHGVDLVEESLQEASRRSVGLIGESAAAERLHFSNEPQGSYDLVCALAVFSVDEGPATLELWQDTIDRLWDCTEKTLVFDLLREEPGFDHVGHRRMTMPEISQIANELSHNHIVDATFADHFALVVAHRTCTRSRLYWQVRESTGACT